MTKYLFLLVSALMIVTGVNARTVKNLPTNPNNTSCAAAMQLCQNYSVDIDFTIFSNCMGGNVKLYYAIKCATTGTSTALLGITTTTSSTLKIYGPYNSISAGCEQYNSLASPLQTLTGVSHTISLAPVTGKYYLIEMTTACVNNITCTPVAGKLSCDTDQATVSCEDCVGSFQPPPGNYVFTGWTMEAGAALTKTSYTFPRVTITTSGSTLPALVPSGPIIDGWQRIEGVFTVTTAGTFSLVLSTTSASVNVYFDDLRIYPVDGSMMSYVYDPLTLRLVAELDERNYAKFYDYDEEGKLIRVEKETEKGIFTINETRENSSGKP